MASSPPARPPSTSRASSKSTFTPALARYVAATRPLMPPPMMMRSRVIGSLPPVAQDAERRQTSRCAHDATAGVGPGAALIEAPDRGAVLRPARRRPEEEELVQRQLSLEDVPFGQSGGALDVGRRDDLPVENRLLEIRRVARERIHHRVAERLALGVGPAPAHVV